MPSFTLRWRAQCPLAAAGLLELPCSHRTSCQATKTSSPHPLLIQGNSSNSPCKAATSRPGPLRPAVRPYLLPGSKGAHHRRCTVTPVGLLTHSSGTTPTTKVLGEVMAAGDCRRPAIGAGSTPSTIDQHYYNHQMPPQWR